MTHVASMNILNLLRMTLRKPLSEHISNADIKILYAWIILLVSFVFITMFLFCSSLNKLIYAVLMDIFEVGADDVEELTFFSYLADANVDSFLTTMSMHPHFKFHALTYLLFSLQKNENIIFTSLSSEFS